MLFSLPDPEERSSRGAGGAEGGLEAGHAGRTQGGAETEGGDRRDKCCQKAGKGFPVVEFSAPVEEQMPCFPANNRGAGVVFRQSVSGQRRQGVSPKQREFFGSCLGIFLQVPVPRETNHSCCRSQPFDQGNE